MKKFLALALSILLILPFTACSNDSEKTSGGSEQTSGDSEQASDDNEQTSGEVVEIIGIADLVPHSELIEYVAPKLLEQGVK